MKGEEWMPSCILMHKLGIQIEGVDFTVLLTKHTLSANHNPLPP